jgi:hypothetical protein
LEAAIEMYKTHSLKQVADAYDVSSPALRKRLVKAGIAIKDCNEVHIGIKHSPDTIQKMKDNNWSKRGYQHANFGKTLADHTKERISEANSSTWCEKIACNPEATLEWRKKISCTKQNIEIEEFDGFVSSENTQVRESAALIDWRQLVFKKADFTCYKCGQRGGELQAHHAQSFNAYPEYRFDVNNGICLCASCHHEFHKRFGYGDNTEQQLNEWLVQS